MKIEYRLEQKDWVRIMTYQSWNAPASRRVRRALYGICAGLAALGLIMAVGGTILSGDLETRADWVAQGLVIFFWGVLWGLLNLLMLPLTTAAAVKGLLKKETGLAGECSLELDDGGLTARAEGRTLRLKWRGMRKLTVHRQYLYIFQGPAEATAIPLRALASPEERREFLQRLTAGSGLAVNGPQRPVDDHPEVVERPASAVTYTVDQNDLTAGVEFFRLYLRQGRPLSPWPLRLGGLLLFICVFSPYLWTVIYGGGVGPGLIVGAGLLAALMISASRLTRWLVRLDVDLAVRHNFRCPAIYALELRDDGFVEYAGAQELEVKWSRLKALAVDDGWLHFLARGPEFFVIPLTAFRSDAEREAFLQKLSAASGLPMEDRRVIV